MAAEEAPPHIEVEGEPEILGGFKQIHRGHFAPADAVGRYCAVAMLQPHVAARMPDMLAREVRMWRLVHGHDNILTMYHFDEGSHGSNPMIIMELIDPIGHDLIGAANRCLHNMANRVPVAELAGYFKQLAGALRHIHGCGVLHRDLNASQVLVTGSCVKLSDFGLAATIEEVQRDEAIRPLFSRCAAPETKKDDHPFAPAVSAYGPPVDLWGLGWILREIFDGHAQIGEVSRTLLLAYDGLSQTAPRRRWTLEQLEACAWMQTVAEARMMMQRELSQVDFPLTSLALGPIRRFSRKFRAYALIIPETWPADGHTLEKLVLPGHDGYTPLLVDMDPSSDRTGISSIPCDGLVLIPGQCVYIGVQDIQAVAGNTQLIIDLTDQGLGMVDATIIPYSLDLDCFEFPRDEVGPESAALGKRDHAKEVGVERALDFKGRHKLHLAGVAKSSADGGFEVEWVPQPTTVVRPGDLGLVPRIPMKPLGRSRRDPELARDTRVVVPPMIRLNRTRTEEPPRTKFSPRPGSDASAEEVPDLKYNLSA